MANRKVLLQFMVTDKAEASKIKTYICLTFEIRYGIR